MTLIDRYLNAVRWQLPESGRDDIVEEIRDTLLSRIEEKEAALGRRLVEAEVEDLLHAYGHPMRVAARYRTRQHLIGPEILPLYEFALRIAGGVVLIFGAIDLLTGLMAGEAVGRAVTGAMHGVWHDGIYILGILTFVAIVLEFSGVKLWTGKWRLRDLPTVPARRVRRRAFEAVFSVGVSVLLLLWWTSVAPFPEAWLRSHVFDGARIEPTSIWSDLYGPILVFLAAGLVRALADLLSPNGVRARGVARIAEAAAGVWVAVGLLGADEWARIVGDASPGAAAALNQALHVCWLGAIAIFAVEALKGSWMAVRGRC